MIIQQSTRMITSFPEAKNFIPAIFLSLSVIYTTVFIYLCTHQVPVGEEEVEAVIGGVRLCFHIRRHLDAVNGRVYDEAVPNHQAFMYGARNFIHI